ncbi:TPA_asm: L [Pentaphragma betacytorhabdovirus 1]|nr:TPA_asm: L [Pentaphragma betacytorhabdovirus 1]
MIYKKQEPDTANMDDTLDIFERRALPGIGDFHLRSAITPIDIDALDRGLGMRNTLSAYNRLKSTEGPLHVGTPAKLLYRLFSQEIGYTLTGKAPQKWDVLTRIIEAENRRNEMQGGFPTLLARITSLISQKTMRFSNYPWFFAIFSVLVSASNAISSGRPIQEEFFDIGRESEGLYSYRMKSGMTIILAGELFLVKYLSASFLYTIDTLRMISDKIAERTNILLSSELGSPHLGEIYITQEKVLTLFKQVDSFLGEFGNNAYKLIKNHEPFCWGLLQAQSGDDICDSESFLNEMVRAAKEDFPHVAVDKYLSTLTEICSTPHHFSQVAGMFREWGHPVVDSVVGFNQVRQFGTAEKREDTVYPIIAGRKCKEIFFVNYRKQHQQYPPYESAFGPEDECDNVNISLSSNLPINFKSAAYALSSWDKVEVKDTFPIPETFNLSLIVADTAISPTRSEISRATHAKETLKPDVRRGVLKFIKDGVVNCGDLLRDIQINPLGLDADHRIIGLYPKEREINPKARMFALMSLSLRAYIVVTEDLLSGLLKYFPGITMTDDLLTLSKKIISYTTSQSTGSAGSRTFIINSDFIKWNLNFRKWTTFQVFLILGKLFGLSQLFNRTYDIFASSIIYLADGSFLPKLDKDHNLAEDSDPNKSYNNHAGGFEGLRQKGWTIFTVIIIAFICDKLGIKYKLMGQGDNQVIIITIYSEREKLLGYADGEVEREYKDKLNAFMKEFTYIFECLGLPLKVSETWISQSLFLYGKIPVFKGISLASSYKRLARIFPFSNEDLMTLDNAMSAVSANAITAAAADVQPYISLILAKWHHILCTTMFLQYHPLKGEAIYKLGSPARFSVTYDGSVKRYVEPSPIGSTELIISIIMSSKSLGGTNGVNESQLIMRGFPDPVSRDLDNLYWMCYSNCNSDPTISRISLNWMKVFLSPSHERTMLIEDPTALNLLVPPQTLSITRKLIRESIKGAPSTSQFGDWFKELLSVSDQQNRKELIRSLTNGDVIFPRLAHEVYASSLYGYSESILSKIDKTVTLSRVSLSKNQVDVVGILLRGETRYFNYLIWRSSIRRPADMEPFTPVSEYASAIRQRGWGAVIEAVTVPFPSQFLQFKLCNVLSEHRPGPGVNYFTVAISEIVSNSPNQLYTSVGRSAPYLGSKTEEKLFGKHEKAIYGTEPLIRRPVNLARLLGWIVDTDSNYGKLIRAIIRSVTDEDPEEFIRHIERPSGSAAHRLKDSATDHGALYNSLHSPVTHLSLSSENLFDYGKGTTNVNLHFQACLCYIQSRVIQLVASGKTLTTPMRVVHFHFINEPGLGVVVDDVPDLPNEIGDDLIPSRPHNPYLFLNKDKIKYVRDRFNTIRSSAQVLGEGALAEMSEAQVQKLITENLGYLVGKKILSGRSGSNEDTENLLFDVQSINRFYPKKIPTLDLFNMIYSFLFTNIYQTAMQEDSDSFPTLSSIKRKVVKEVSTSHANHFVDLVPAVTDLSNLNCLRQSQLNSPALSYPLTPSALCLSARSTLRNYIINTREPPKWAPFGVLLDEFSTEASGFINYLLVSRSVRRKVSCIYCASACLSFKLRHLEDLSELFRIKCKLGHDSGRLYYKNTSWGLLKSSISTALKMIPDLDPFLCEKILFNIPDNFSPCVDIIWTESDRQIVWTDTLILSPGDFPHLDSVHSTYNLFGIHKVPTNGYARVAEIMMYLLSSRTVCKSLSGDNILVLGDGFGYSSCAVRDLFGGRPTAWSYIRTDESCPHMLELSYPPAHEILNYNQEIDSSPSRLLESDICTPLWRSSYDYLNQYHHYQLLVSEIELFYVRDGLTEYQEYFNNLMYCNCNTVVVRMKYMNYAACQLIISKASCHYRSVKVVRGGIRSGGTNDLWMICSSRLSSPRCTMYLSNHSAREAFSSWSSEIKMNSRNAGETVDYVRSFDALTWRTELTTFYEDYITSWFLEAEISSWDGDSLTSLWYELETSRRPQNISDQTGRDKSYLFFEKAKLIKTRLLVLMLARCSDDILLYEFSRIQEWKLYWLKVRNSRRNPLNNWTLCLIREDSVIPKGLERYRVESSERELDLMKVFPYLRQRRNWTMYTNLNELVEFKYSPKFDTAMRDAGREEDTWDCAGEIGEFGEDGEYLCSASEWTRKTIEGDLIFPISKRASYSARLF